MRPSLALLTWLSLATVSMAQVPQATPGSALSIDVPAGPVRLGDYAWMRVRGLTMEATPVAMVMHFPPAVGELEMVARRIDNTWVPTLIFRAALAGDYYVVLVSDNEVAVGKLTYGDGPPPPPPPPPPPTEKWQVTVFHQSDWLTNAGQGQLDMIAGRAFRDELVAKGHVFVGGFDVDALTPRGRLQCGPNGCVVISPPKELEPYSTWWKAIQGRAPPLLAIAPRDGGAVRVFPLPVDKAAVWQLLGEQK